MLHDLTVLMAQQWNEMLTIIDAMRSEPARWGSVVFGWSVILFLCFRAGSRVDAYFQDIIDGKRGWF